MVNLIIAKFLVYKKNYFKLYFYIKSNFIILEK